MIPRYDILTLHPELVRAPLSSSILGRASKQGLIDVNVVDIRDYSENKHRTVDDSPYGGGAGMVMRVDVVARALDAIRSPESHVVLTSPAGRVFDQRVAQQWTCKPHLVFLCGHYEGIDARIETLVDESVSLGDFVLTGGEIAAVAFVDAVARLIPGVIGNPDSLAEESFSSGVLEYPQYTRPRVWREQEVPAVLLSGHHDAIERWRSQQALERTRLRRPDLFKEVELRRAQAKDVDASGRNE